MYSESSLWELREKLGDDEYFKFISERDKKENLQNDVQPSYYINTNGNTCNDAIDIMTKDFKGIEAFCVGNIIKYIWRFKKKNGITDLEKAKSYLNLLIEYNKNF